MTGGFSSSSASLALIADHSNKNTIESTLTIDERMQVEWPRMICENFTRFH